MTQSDSNSIYHFISTAKDIDDLLYIENYFTNHPLTQLLPKKNILQDLHRIHDDILYTPVPNVGHTKGLLGIIKCMQQLSFPEDDKKWIEEHESFTHLINKSIKYITIYLEAEDTFNYIYEKILDIIINAVKYHPALKTKLLLCLSPAVFDIGIKRMLPVFLFKKSVNCLISMVTRTEPEKRKEVMEVVYPKLSKFFDQLYTCGDFDTQLNVVEAILRYIVPDKNRKQFVSYFKHKSPMLIHKFLSIRGKDFDMDCRLFLNYINKSQGEQALVVSVPCYSVLLDEMSVEKPPEHQLFWVDFNRRSQSVSIWCNKNSLLTEEERTIAEYLSTTDWLSIVITPDTVKEVVVKSPDSQSGLHCNYKEVLFYINGIITIKPLSNLKCSKSKCIHIVFPVSKDTEGLDEKILYEIFPSRKKNNTDQADINKESNREDKTKSDKYCLESKPREKAQINKPADSILLENNSDTNVSSSQRQVKKEIEVKKVRKVSVTTFIQFQQKWESKNHTPQYGCKVAQSIKSVCNETFIASKTKESENILNNSDLRPPKISQSIGICKLNYFGNKTHCRNVTKEGENSGEESNEHRHYGKVNDFKEHKDLIPHIEAIVVPAIDKKNDCSEAQVACGQLNSTVDNNKEESMNQDIHQTHIKMCSNNEKTSKNEALKYKSKSNTEQFRKTVKMGKAENNAPISVARPTSMSGLHSSEQTVIYHSTRNQNDTKSVQQNHDSVETINRFEDCNTNLRKEEEMTNSVEVQTPKLPLISKSEQRSTHCKNHNKEQEVKECKNSSGFSEIASKLPKALDVLENVNSNGENHVTCGQNFTDIGQKSRKLRRSTRLQKKPVENGGSKIIQDKYLVEQLKSLESNIQQNGEENVDKMNNYEKLPVHVVEVQENEKEPNIYKVNNSKEEARETEYSKNLDVKEGHQYKLTKNKVQVRDEKSQVSTDRKVNLCEVNPNATRKKIHPLKEVGTEVENRDITLNILDTKKSISCVLGPKETILKSECKKKDKMSCIESILDISEKAKDENQSYSDVTMITKLSDNQGNHSKTNRRLSLAKYPAPNEGLFCEKQETSEETKPQHRIGEGEKSLLEINETKSKKIDSLMKVSESSPELRKQMTSFKYGELQAVHTLNGKKISENSTALCLDTEPNLNSSMNNDDIRSLKARKVFPKTIDIARGKLFIKELDDYNHGNIKDLSKSNCGLKLNKNSLKQDPRNTVCSKKERENCSETSKAYLREEKGEAFSNSPKPAHNSVVQGMKDGGQNDVSKSSVFTFFSSTSALKSSKVPKLSTLDNTLEKKKNKNLPQFMVIDEINTANDNDFHGIDSSLNDFKMRESSVLMSKRKSRKSMVKETMIKKIPTSKTKKNASKSVKNDEFNEHSHVEQSSTRHLRKRKAVSYACDSPLEESALSLLQRNKENIDSLEINHNPNDQKVKGKRSVKRKLFTNNQEDIVSVHSASQSSSSRYNQDLKLKYPFKDKKNTSQKIENEDVQDEFDLVIASIVPPLPRKVNYWEEKYRKERKASIKSSSKPSKSQKTLHSIYSDFESESDMSFDGFKVPVDESKKTDDSIQAPSKHNTTGNIDKYTHEVGRGAHNSSLLSSPERLRGNKSPDVCPSPQSSSFSSSSYKSIDKIKENKTKKETKTEREKEQILENNTLKPSATNNKMSKGSESLRKKLIYAQNEITKKKTNDLMKNNSSSEENIEHESIPQYSKRCDITSRRNAERKVNKLMGSIGRKEGHEVTVIHEESTTLTKYSKDKTFSPNCVNGGDTSPNECIKNQFEYNFGRDANKIQCNPEICSKKVDGVAISFSPKLEYVKQPEINIREKKKHILRKTCMSNEKNLEDDNTNSETHGGKLISNILGKDVSSQNNLENMTVLNNSNSGALKSNDITLAQFDYHLDTSDDKSIKEMKELLISDENLIAERNVCSSSKMRKINVTNTEKIVSQVKHTIHHYKECHNASDYVSATSSSNKNTSSSSSISELAEGEEEEEDKESEEEVKSISQNNSMNSTMKVHFARLVNEKSKHINTFSKNTAKVLLNKLSEASTSFVQERSLNRTVLEDAVLHNVKEIEKEMQGLDSYEEFLNHMKSEFISVSIKQNMSNAELQRRFSNLLGAYETFVSASKIDNHFDIQDLLTSLKQSYQKRTLKDMLQKLRKIYNMSP